MKTLLIFFTLFTTSIVFAQLQIENSGFEGDWENVTGSEDEPAEWSSLKTADALGLLAPIVLFQSTEAHTGIYCARLKNTTSAGIVANGIMTNGQVHADFEPENGYVYTNTSNTDWNYAFTDRPDSLVAWVKYAPVGGDKGKVEVLLHTSGATGKLPESGSTAHWIAKARCNINVAYGSWTRVSAPFHYYSAANPDYALVVVTSGDSTIAVDGSEMWIDDIELIYNPPGTGIDEAKNPFYVYAHQMSLIVNSANFAQSNLRIYGLDGREVLNSPIESSYNQFPISTPGVYIYQIEQSGRIYSGKVVITG